MDRQGVERDSGTWGDSFLLAWRGGWCIFAHNVAKIYRLRRTSTLALRQRKALLLRQLFVPTDLVRASFVQRFTTCGKPKCVCVTGQKHGPFYYLIANLGPGHILKSLLKTPAQQQAVQQGVAGYQAHWDRLEELSQINLELFHRGEPLKGP
jgi:uncharacterized protein DUF6788